MKFLVKSLSLVVIIAILSGCASIVSRNHWPLTVNTNPAGAKVEIKNKKGNVVYIGLTPAILTLKSGAGFFGKQSYTVKLTLDGFNDKIIPIGCDLNGWYAGNIIFGGLIGMLIVDPATGAMYRLDTKYINETFTKNTSSIEPSLQIININDIPSTLKEHLVCIK